MVYKLGREAEKRWRRLDGSRFIVKVLSGVRFIDGEEQGLWLYDGAAFRRFPTEADTFLHENELTLPGAVLSGGRFVLGTIKGGVVVIDRQGRILRTIDQAAGLQDNSVRFVYVDRAGSLWLGLDKGLARVDIASPLRRYDAASGLTSAIESIALHQGTFYVGATTGVFRMDPATSTFRLVEGAGVQVLDLLSMDATLLAVSLDGLHRIEGNRAVLIRRSVSSGFRAYVLHRSRKDDRRLFVGLRDGLASVRLDPSGTLVEEVRIPGIEERIYSIVERDDGNLWLGTLAKGVLRVHFPEEAGVPLLYQAQVVRFGASHGLPQGGAAVFSVEGRAYFATRDEFFRFDEAGQRFVPDSTFARVSYGGNPSNYTLKADSWGRVWINFGRETALALPQPGGGYAVETAPFRPLASINEIYPEDDNVIWFGGTEGLVSYHASVEKDYAAAYPALIRRVVVGADSLLYGGAARAETVIPVLRYAENGLRFEYAAPFYEQEDKTEYQVYLEGFDRGWSSWSREAHKEYTNLPPAAYQFRVRAKNVYRHKSTEAAYGFRVLSPWWRRWWAYLLYGLIFAGGVFVVNRVQRRRLIRKERARAHLREAELRAEANEARANYLQSENLRQSQELEAARALQLSMLPKAVPEHPRVKLAAFMQTATEVGGDYYDFDVSSDGTLTIVIGDATGHGTRAGTMVTATKSLWNAFSGEADLERVLEKLSKALKRMGMPKLYMALALVRLRDNTLELTGAGMPPAVVYRASTKQVETITLKGIPLGGPGAFLYRKTCITFLPGDTVVLMSDGFPELFSDSGEMLGYERAVTVFEEVASRSPEEIITHLTETGQTWANGRAQDDDVTFVVMKVKVSTGGKDERTD